MDWMSCLNSLTYRAAYCRFDYISIATAAMKLRLFSSLYPWSLHNRSIISLPILPDLSRVRSASLAHKLRMCCILVPFALLIQLLLLPRLSMIFAATSEHQPIRHINIGIASQWCNSRSSDRSAKSSSLGCLLFFHFPFRSALRLISLYFLCTSVHR